MHYCRAKMDDLYFLGDAMKKSGPSFSLFFISPSRCALMVYALL